MEALFWGLLALRIIVFVHMGWKITKYEKVIKRCIETDTNQLYQENKKLKKQVQDLSDCLDDIQAILDDFKEEGDEN